VNSIRWQRLQTVSITNAPKRSIQRPFGFRLRGLCASVLRFLSFVSLIVLFFSAATLATANEPYAKFLRALEDNGLSDVALEYLDRIEKLPDLPPEVRETLDLERSNCLRAAARDAYDARQAEQLLADSQKYLDKFLAGHPNHPAAATSILMWGDSLFELGQRSAAAARRATDAAQKAKLFGEARQYFKQAESRYGDAQERFRASYSQLSPEKPETDLKPQQKSPEASAEQQEAERGAVQARFKLGLVKYQLAQTYEDAKSPERAELLKAAAKCFNDIFQQYRSNADDERCIAAQLWHGKTLAELGDEQTAIEVFDELLVRDTTPSETALSPFFAQATFFKYGIWRKEGKIDELIDDGGKWVDARKSWAKDPYFNGVALELAHAYQTQAENLTGDAQQKTLQKAAVLLADASKIESPYKTDIVLLRRDVLQKLGGKNIGAAEFIALGDIALREDNVADATKNYELARQKALDAKDEKAVAEAKSALGRVALRQAQVLLEKKQYEEALSAAEALAQGDAADPNTVAAAELSLRSAYFLGAASADKKDAFVRLEKAAGFVKNKWPGRPVADVARMILAQSLLQKGDTAGALQMFAEVKPESSRYPWALYNIGRIEWITYLEEKKKQGDRNEKLMAESGERARESLQKCIDVLQTSPGRKLTSEDEDSAETAQASQLDSDAKLLQSEIYLDGKEYQKAVERLDPLARKLKTDPERSSDAATAVFGNLIRARLGIGEAEKAADNANELLAFTADEPRANAKLVIVARLLNQELKVAEAAVTDAQGDAQKLEAATARRDAIKQRLRQFAEPLGKRAKHSLSDLVFLGDACFSLDLADEGGQIYQSLLDRAKDDPAFAKKSEKVLVFAQSRLVDVLRGQGKLDEALKQADDLIAKNPRALSPKMTRADILEDLAKQDPKKFEDAITQWSEIRVLLSRDNPKRPEYFDVVYRVAKGLVQQCEKSKDKSKLVPAEQLLKTTLIQYAALGGRPDLVAKYNELLKKIEDAKSKK
jgi:hypothetical protein